MATVQSHTPSSLDTESAILNFSLSFYPTSFLKLSKADMFNTESKGYPSMRGKLHQQLFAPQKAMVTPFPQTSIPPPPQVCYEVPFPTLLNIFLFLRSTDLFKDWMVERKTDAAPSSTLIYLVCEKISTDAGERTASEFWSWPLEVALPIQGGGEGHVVKSTRHLVGARVRCHSGNAVLCLVRRKLTPQLLGCDVVLKRRIGKGWVEVSYHKTLLEGHPNVHIHTLSPARILNEAMTWSAVSVSVVSLDMKSMKAWKVTAPLLLGSTIPIIRANSASPWRTEVRG